MEIFALVSFLTLVVSWLVLPHPDVAEERRIVQAQAVAAKA
jgi:hypothetical protein